MFTALENFATAEIIFEESNSSSFSFIHKCTAEISCNIEMQMNVKSNQLFYIKGFLKNDTILLYRSHMFEQWLLH